MVTVLIADNEAVINLMISEMFKTLGHTVVSQAYSGPEAVQETVDKNPDLVLLDISMAEEQDGISACKEIKEKHPGSLIVFMTAYPEGTFTNALRGIVYDGYLEKPVRLEKLKYLLKKLGV